jgi:hypothetical protein
MQDREAHSGIHIRLDPQTRRLMLVDQHGTSVPADQRKAYIDRMTKEELRALVEAFFELPST